MREWADKEARAEIDAALEAPNRWDAARGKPLWYESDDAAWAEFQQAMRA